jgi:hypothetical protein
MTRPRPNAFLPVAGLAATLLFAAVAGADDKCRALASDATDIAGVRAAIARQCPCASFDGSSDTKDHKAFVACAKAAIADASDGTPLLGFTLRKPCKGELTKLYSKANCGYAPADNYTMCCEAKVSSGKNKGGAKAADKCVDSSNGSVIRNACNSSPFSADACSLDATNSCVVADVVQETVDLASPAEPAQTPGSPGVVVTNPKLIAQFGGPSFSLNKARYTRYHLTSATGSPDAILVLVPPPTASRSRSGATTAAPTSSRTSRAWTSPRNSRVLPSRWTGTSAASSA